MLIGFSGYQVETLSNAFASQPEVQAVVTDTLSIGNLTRNNSNQSIRLNQNGTAYSLSKYGYSYLLLPYLRSIPSVAGSAAFSVLNSKVTSVGLMFAGEIISVALAQSGNTGLAGYFGSGADPLIDLFELTDRQDLRASNDAEKVQLFLYDALLTTGQGVLNVLTRPVSRILDVVSVQQDPNTSIGWNGSVGSMSWENKTNDGVYENRTLSMIGTNLNDLIQAPLYVDGRNGDDVILGRMNRNDDKYIAYINTIADSIYYRERPKNVASTKSSPGKGLTPMGEELP